MAEHPKTDPAIEVSGLVKRFGEKTAVQDLSLRVAAGCVYGFIGPNGAGKSTAIRMLMGLLPMDAGSATVLGMDVRGQSQAIRRHVGYVPEQHFIYRWMRVREVLSFCRQLHETWNMELGRQLVEQFELPLNTKVKQLSKGMLAKLALLVALAPEPRLLILDEPTSGLDVIIREEFLQSVLQTFCQGGRTVFYSSHTLSDIERLADTVGIINNGSLLVECPVSELLSRTKRVRVALQQDSLPAALPQGTIRARRNRRECVLTVTDFSAEKLERLSDMAEMQVVEVMDVGLEDIFKDYVLGQREAV